VPGSGEADFQPFGLAEPPGCFGFGDAGCQVGADLGEPWSLRGVGAQQRAS
jgi:hypothetical protein